MLNFRKIKISDKPSFDKIVKPLNSILCAHCFTDLFIWNYSYDTQISFTNEFVFIKQTLNNETLYTFPLGNGDIKAAVNLIVDDAKEQNIPLHIAAVTPSQMQLLERHFPDTFEYTIRRDNADYIYTSESLQTLSGKKLHSKRNFINRFKSEYEGRWSYEKITNDNIHNVFDYHISWCALNNNDRLPDFLSETCAISLALKNFDALELKGGLLTIDNKIVAFTLGSQATEEMFVVHIEKADHTITGCYQMINNLFAINNFDNVKLINREEDLGLEGLRKAKLSYNPVMMGENYSVKVVKKYD